VILRYPNSITLNINSGSLAQPLSSPYSDGTDDISVFTGGTGVISFS
jgi:hypothetical protein